MNKQLQFVTKAPGVIEVRDARNDVAEPVVTQCLIVRAHGLDKTGVKMWSVLDTKSFCRKADEIPFIAGDYQTCKKKVMEHFSAEAVSAGFKNVGVFDGMGPVCKNDIN